MGRITGGGCPKLGIGSCCKFGQKMKLKKTRLAFNYFGRFVSDSE
jgi:hypothetical protein